MNKQTFAVIAGAVILLAVGIFGAMAYTGSDDTSDPMMTMPDGSTMPSDEMTTGGMDEMEDGSTMDGEGMTTP